MPYANKEDARACWRRREAKPERKKYVRDWKKRITSWRKYALKSMYGLTLEQYNQMLIDQGGGCAICGKSPKPDKVLFVDHNHSTGKIRGLLCAGCNNGLGFLGDTSDGLRRAIQYLELYDQADKGL